MLEMAGPQAELALHQHGKSRVRIARVWRQGDGECRRASTALCRRVCVWDH